MPLSTPVAELKATPAGSGPLSLNVGSGNPVAVTEKLVPVPTAKATLFELLIAGD
jgi:hypothetical protein